MYYMVGATSVVIYLSLLVITANARSVTRIDWIATTNLCVLSPDKITVESVTWLGN